MAVSNYAELRSHVGHNIECAAYGDQNVAVECVDCSTVLFDFDATSEPTEQDDERDKLYANVSRTEPTVVVISNRNRTGEEND